MKPEKSKLWKKRIYNSSKDPDENLTYPTCFDYCLDHNFCRWKNVNKKNNKTVAWYFIQIYLHSRVNS